jgi:hypothetical protein
MSEIMRAGPETYQRLLDCFIASKVRVMILLVCFLASKLRVMIFCTALSQATRVGHVSVTGN